MSIPDPYVDPDEAYEACVNASREAINAALEAEQGAGTRSQDATTAMALVMLAGEIRAIKASLA